MNVIPTRSIHPGACYTVATVVANKATIRRRFHARIAMASWRGYANMLLGRVQYVGKSRVLNKIQRQVRLVEQVDMPGNPG